MTNKSDQGTLGWFFSLMIFAAALFISPIAVGDDADDVMAVVNQWADLEDDLSAQERLIRDDRVMIAGTRQSDQAKNMAQQKAAAAALAATNGGPPRISVRIESPQVKVYGNTAVVSFMRIIDVIPNGQAPLPANLSWMTLVLVKEGGDWGIAHTHFSAIN